MFKSVSTNDSRVPFDPDNAPIEQKLPKNSLTRSISSRLGFKSSLITSKQAKTLKKYDKVAQNTLGKIQVEAITLAKNKEYGGAQDSADQIKENMYVKDVTYSKIAKVAAKNGDYDNARKFATQIEDPSIRDLAYKKIALVAEKKINYLQFEKTLEGIEEEGVKEEALRGKTLVSFGYQMKSKFISKKD